MTTPGSYTITETLYADAGVALYRGRRSLDGGAVIIKALGAAAPDPRALERLQHEYAIACQLDSPYLLKPAGLEIHGGPPRLIFEDFGGPPLMRLLGTPLKTGRFLDLAMALAAALADLHRQGVVHKDLRPANILWDPRSGAVKLTGLGIAVYLGYGPAAPAPITLIEGALAYMAPEQTGRLPRGVDHRSDLYTLGVTCYELLTGALPFTATDPLEWVHCHIARQPLAPDALVPTIPAPLAAIVLKLLAKPPEQRYQSARGLLADLERCRAQWQVHGRIAPFPLGTRDRSDRFTIPAQLYGRETQLAALAQAFEQRAGGGQPGLVLVAGPAGIGKSALVAELRPLIARHRGYFIAGKFDQQQRERPYAPLAQAFQALIPQILTESDARIQHWNAELQAALGANGQLLVDLVPQLGLILGSQPAVPALPPAETQHRLHRVVHQFIQVFATPAHPLVLFVDDLQWADPASLAVISFLISAPAPRALLLIGAYRDNEVGPAHPLRHVLDPIGPSQVPVVELGLRPLTLAQVRELVAATVQRPARAAAPLARLVYTKTGGNPFFVVQFVTRLYQERLLRYDERQQGWRWDLAAIRQQGFTDNVVELLLGRLQRLEAATQEALIVAACLGNTTERQTLAWLSAGPEADLPAALAEAVAEGLLVEQDGAYRFVHDRVQEAAYALLPDAQRPAQHLRIGRLLLAQTPEAQRAEQIFCIAGQLNRGAALLETREERERLAELNLSAGRRARAATAFASARSYFEAGTALLGADAWEACYELAFALHLEQAECAFLSGAPDQAERLAPLLMQQAQTRLKQAAVYRLKIDIHIIKGETRQAIENIIVCLGLFGIDIAPHPSADEVQEAYQAIWRILDARRIEELIDLPLMTDPEMQLAMEIMARLYIPAFNSDQNLFNLHLCYGVQLSLRHGNAAASVQFYGWFGIILAIVFHRYQDGYRFARLAFDLMERHQFLAYKAKANYQMRQISYWTQPLDTVLAYARAALEAALATGDVPVACFCCYDIVLGRLIRGDRLSDVQYEAERGYDFVKRAGFRDVCDMIVGMERLVQAMRGGTRHLSTYDDDRFSEAAFEADLDRDRMPSLVCYYYVMKLMARVLSGDYDAALAAGEKSKALLWSALFALPRYCYYYSLTLAAVFDRLAPERQQEARAMLATHEAQLREWAEHYPPTFEHPYALVAAEIARLDGKYLDAEQRYEQAIQSAHENGFVQNEALAYELAATFYRNRGFTLVANTYLREARACYARWGAEAKLRQLDQRYPQLAEAPPTGPAAAFAARPEQFDLLAVVKASQSISGQLQLPDLLEALLEIVLAQAGAQRGLLLLVAGEALRIHAQAETFGATTRVTLVPALPPSPTTLPVSILSYVRRTGEALVLADAAAEPSYAADPYLVRHKPRSLLCLPIRRQTQLIGLLYLENNLTAGAFSTHTLTVLELLAAQAAISLQTALLYADLQQENAERRQAEADLRASEARFRTFVDHATDAFFLNDEQGRILDVNRHACESLGYSREELIEMTPYDFDVDVDRSFLDQIGARLDADEVLTFDSRHRRKDGSVFPVEIRVRSFWQDGHRFAVSLVRDVSERKRAERALLESYSLLNAVVEGTTDAIYVKDLQGRYLMINVAGAHLLGKTVAEVIGHDDRALFPPEAAQATMERDRQVLATGQAQTGEETVTLAGVQRTYLATRGVYRDRHGQVIGLIGIARDITELKRLEAQFRQAQKMEAVGRLAGGVAHDFNNLLTVINGNSELLFDSLVANDPDRELLAEIITAGERAANLTRQLLAFSRKQLLQPEVVSLNSVLEQVLKLLQRLLGEDITLSLLPDTGLGLTRVDVGQFEQAIINLAVNARDAMPGGGRLTIETHNIELDDAYAELRPEVRPGRYVLVAVSDSGHGMDAATRACIFEPFFTTKEPGRGTGLGLAMVYGFIKQSGGQIEVYSEVGQGTTFKLYLPRADAGLPAASALPRQLTVAMGSETVLLVEDEAAVRNLLRRILRSCGYTILEAQDGQEAIAVAQQHAGRIDLLVTDLVMPGMSGRELAERLALARPEMRTLLMSGYSDEVVTRQGVLHAGVAFMQKPFSLPELARKVREVLDAAGPQH